jgi:hypothetical protein
VIGRLRRLVGAGGGTELRDLERAIKRLADAHRDQAARLEARLGAVADDLTQRASAKDATEIVHAIRSLTKFLNPDDDGAVFRALDAVARGTGPIVVGPWTGEVGFEVLYWAPFVEWFRTRWRVDERRFVILSRGGVASWYGLPGAQYTDIFSLVSVDTFRARTDQDAHKQRSVALFDRELVESVVTARGLAGVSHLHPEVMYRALAPFWKDEAGFGLVQRFTTHRRLEPFDHPAAPALPASYVACRFYFSDAFPDTPANRALARAVVAALSRNSPVVLLSPGIRIDDHGDFVQESSGNVHLIAGSVKAEENLALQTAVISRARAFVGTYGGYAYLAPIFGVPSVALYSHRNFKLHHLHAAQRVCDGLGRATVLAVDAADVALLQWATAI